MFLKFILLFLKEAERFSHILCYVTLMLDGNINDYHKCKICLIKIHIFTKLYDYDPFLNLSYREKSNYVGATFQGKMCDANYAGGVVLVWYMHRKYAT